MGDSGMVTDEGGCGVGWYWGRGHRLWGGLWRVCWNWDGDWRSGVDGEGGFWGEEDGAEDVCCEAGYCC